MGQADLPLSYMTINPHYTSTYRNFMVGHSNIKVTFLRGRLYLRYIPQHCRSLCITIFRACGGNVYFLHLHMLVYIDAYHVYVVYSIHVVCTYIMYIFVDVCIHVRFAYIRTVNTCTLCIHTRCAHMCAVHTCTLCTHARCAHMHTAHSCMLHIHACCAYMRAAHMFSQI